VSDFLIVVATALISGGFAIPLGFLLDMSPIAVYFAAVIGAVIGMVVFAFVGGGIRQIAVSRMKDPEAAQAKVSKLLGRWGVHGLGLIGPIFPGVTVTVIVGMAIGVDRNQLVKWMTIGILGLYAVYVVGLAILVELTGV
jgi:membrane protein DedA with SNARE-associated domain